MNETGDAASMVGDPPALDARRTFPGVPEQCREARLWARSVMRPFPDAADAVEVVVSEFFGNAVRHTASGGPGGVVDVELTGGYGAPVRLTVVDQGACADRPATAARVLAPTLSRPDGRGLFLAAALSSEWGRAPHDGTGAMATWAEFPTERSRS
ncbi:ATP-binding protein [Nocardiopsis halophila]|uniref:ATP-binding protein n=1 Tax=Nocardiopsis halophila TaxID=141692 RepID=UPI0003499755|nr:ATP-binding protein [Nocardiopsis halophila]